MASVSVLLSVTDQPVFLQPLIDSVLNQRDVKVDICARADCVPVSETVSDVFQQRGIELLEVGPPLGVPAAYFRLLSLNSQSADFFAFADHDDLWDPAKLTAACEALGQVDEQVPALWMCQIEPFGDPVDKRPRIARRLPLIPSVGNALTQTLAPGCAMVWNRALQQLLCERPHTSGVLMHDCWLYLIAASIGEVIVDQRPLVRYRLHSDNAVGLDRSWRYRVRRLLRNLRSDAPTLESQAKEALRCFGDLMRPEAHQLVSTVAEGSTWQRIRAVGPSGLQRNLASENAALRVRMLLPARLMNAR
jgi:hypothetical protein